MAFKTDDLKRVISGEGKLSPESGSGAAWVELTTSFIEATWDSKKPAAVIGSPDIDDFFALKVAQRLGRGTLGLTSTRTEDTAGDVVLSDAVKEKIGKLDSGVVYILEDVGSWEDTSAAQLAVQALAAGAPTVEVIRTYPANSEAAQLDQLFIPHHDVTTEPLVPQSTPYVV